MQSVPQVYPDLCSIFYPKRARDTRFTAVLRIYPNSGFWGAKAPPWSPTEDGYARFSVFSLLLLLAVVSHRIKPQAPFF